MKNALSRSLLFSLVFSLAVACDSKETKPPIITGDPATLPGLDAGLHYGMWPTYELVPIGTAAAIDLRWAEAKAAGMKVGRVHVGWDQLEPAPNNFDISDLQSALDSAKADNLQILLLIETIDSDGFQLPSDLIDPNNSYGLAANRRFDDPVILNRFSNLLNEILPLLQVHQIFAISVGNEPDNYFDDVVADSAQGLQWVEALANFLSHARDHIQTQIPGTAVGMTLTQGQLEKGVDAMGQVVDAADVAIFNYYCQDPNFQVQSSTVVAAEVNQIFNAARGKPIVIQELGCPAGKNPTIINASEAAQAAFFEAVATELAAYPAFRAVFAFQMVDWSPSLVSQITQSLRDEGYNTLADQFDESLSSIGLLRYTNGSPRPAWSSFLQAITDSEK